MRTLMSMLTENEASISAQYHPLPQEYLATGLFGIFAYLILLVISLQSTNHYHITTHASTATGTNAIRRSKTTRRFFACMTIMCLLELPRYFALAIDEAYTSRTTYAFHLIANIFFFLAYSIVCRQWSSLLQLASYFQVIYGNRGLFIANIAFAVVDILGIIILSLSFSSLDDFFFSTVYTVITLIESIRNLIYSIFLLFYGIKLIRRFAHFSLLEQQSYIKQHSGKSKRLQDDSWITWIREKCWESAMTFQWLFCSVKGSNERVFTKVVFRLLAVLLLTTMCFLLRMIMLLLKIIVIHDTEKKFTSPTFTLFGFAWFTCSDFIPRLLPSLAFVFLMRSKKPKKNQLTVTHMQGGGFVEGGIDMRPTAPLAAARDRYEDDDDEPSNASPTSSASFSLLSFLAEDPEQQSLQKYQHLINSNEGIDELDIEEYQFGKRKSLLSQDQFVIEEDNEDDEPPAPVKQPSTNINAHNHMKPNRNNEETIVTLSELHRMTASTNQSSSSPVPLYSFHDNDDNTSDYSDEEEDEDDELFAEAAIDKIFSLVSLGKK